MLAFEPASRPGTGELAARLQRCSPEVRSVRRSRLALAAAFILILGATGFFAFRSLHTQNGGINLAISEKSIAVLPFENLSEDKANAYFAEGIQDEILTRLSKIADLKVISRTSTQHYKTAPENLPVIAKQLGVAHIVEGSVQKIGDAVRVNVQLIKAASDSHLWADTFDRKLIDTFSVESEVAKAIADQLRAKLSGEEQQEIAAKPTNNPEAYDAYLRGLAFFRQGNAPSFRKATNSFAEATQLDPNFAAAWALLARMHSLLYFWNDDVTPARREAAHTALETALRLQPNLPEVHLAQAYYQYWIVRDYEGARIIFERLRKNFPNSAEIVETLGYIARRQGRWNESRNYIDAAVALNPRYLYLRWQAAGVCEEMRNFSSALQRYNEALNIWPDDANLLAGKATVYQCLGQLDKADETLQGLHARAEESRAVRTIYYQAILRRHYPAAIALLRSLVEMDDSPAAMPRNIYRTGLGDLQRLSGDSTGAKASYSQARAELEETLKGQPKNTAIITTLALIHAGLGEQEAATKYAERAVSLVPISKDALNGSAYEEIRARIAARFGDREMAIPILERLLKTPCAEPPITPALLKLDPDFDGLRGDARFQSLCQEKKR
jgi:TolB-like protein/Tfp pilus assembly protein PilF